MVTEKSCTTGDKRMKKERFYLNEVAGCIRIIDSDKEDGTSQGIEEAVIRMWEGEHRIIPCPQCGGCGRSNSEVITDAIHRKAQDACDALNQE
jgi:hypothetical protein